MSPPAVGGGPEPPSTGFGSKFEDAERRLVPSQAGMLARVRQACEAVLTGAVPEARPLKGSVSIGVR